MIAAVMAFQCVVQAADLTPADLLGAVYRQGDPVGTVRLALAALSEGEEAQVALQRELALAGLPDWETMLLDARLQLARHGREGVVPAAELSELQVTLPKLEGRLRDSIAAARGSFQLAAAPDLATLKSYLDSQWRILAAENRLEELRAEAAYLLRHCSAIPRRNQELPAAFRRLAGGETARGLAGDIDHLERLFREREFEIRRRRLHRSWLLLQQPGPSPEHWLAAASYRLDYFRTMSYLQQEGKKLPPQLARRRKSLIEEQQKWHDEARLRSGRFTEKAEQLLDGLFWWTRGRYGLGAADFGLAKGPAAAGAAASRLVLPAERPEPVVQAEPNQELVPRFERRHLHWWSSGVELETPEQQQAYAAEHGYEHFQPVLRLGFY